MFWKSVLSVSVIILFSSDWWRGEVRAHATRHFIMCFYNSLHPSMLNIPDQRSEDKDILSHEKINIFAGKQYESYSKLHTVNFYCNSWLIWSNVFRDCNCTEQEIKGSLGWCRLVFPSFYLIGKCCWLVLTTQAETRVGWCRGGGDWEEYIWKQTKLSRHKP